MTTKQAVIAWSGLMLFALSLTGVIWWGYSDHSAKAESTCQPSPDETCPSDTMVTDWQQYKAITDRYKMSREDELKANGLMVEMQKEAQKYPGTNWDDKKLRFVRIKPPVSQAPPPTAAPVK